MPSLYRLFKIQSILFVNLSIFILYPAIGYSQITRELVSPNKQTIYFELPSQPLRQSLVEFAIQSKLTIVVESEVIKGFLSRAIVGPHQPEKALKILLSKSPLDFRLSRDSRSIVIETKSIGHDDTKKNNPYHDSAEEKIDLEEVLVKGTSYPFRYSTISNTQIYGNKPSYDSARFINVIPSSLIADQAAADLSEALSMSSSVTPADGVADSNDDYFIRGFSRFGLYVDGFRLSSLSGVKQLPANIEQVEILKGPSTLFYGQAEPGGIVNVVKKRPKANRSHKIAYIGNTNKKSETVLDLTGPIFKKDNQLLYRFIYSNDKQDVSRDLKDIERQLISPSLTWNINRHSTIDISYEYQQHQQTRPQGTIVLAPVDDEIHLVSVDKPASLARQQFTAEFQMLNMAYHSHLASGWTFRSNLFVQNEERLGVRSTRNSLLVNNFLVRADDLDPDVDIIFIGGIPIPITIGTNIEQGEERILSVATIRSLYDEHANDSALYFKTILNGIFDTGFIKHDLSFGVDSHRQKISETVVLEQRSDIDSIDITNGRSAENQIRAVFDQSSGLGELTIRRQNLNFQDFGLFALDTMQINQHFDISMGLRYTMTGGNQDKHGSDSIIELNKYEQISGELGFRLEVSDTTAVYLNFSEGFKANYRLDDFNTQFEDPEQSNQIELGAKTLLIDGRLSSTVSLFQINKKNTVTTQFIDGLRKSIIDGERTTTGIDFDFNYQATNRLDLLASFSFMEHDITSGEFVGKKPILSANEVGSLFINYHIGRNNSRGLDVNLGGYFVGDRFGDSNNNRLLNNFFIAGTGISYTGKMANRLYKFQLNAKNLLDEDYISSTEDLLRINKGARRSVSASLWFEF